MWKKVLEINCYATQKPPLPARWWKPVRCCQPAAHENQPQLLSDAKRVIRIKALIRDIDVVVCIYPFAFAFMFQQLAKVIGMDSP